MKWIHSRMNSLSPSQLWDFYILEQQDPHRSYGKWQEHGPQKAEGSLGSVQLSLIPAVWPLRLFPHPE